MLMFFWASSFSASPSALSISWLYCSSLLSIYFRCLSIFLVLKLFFFAVLCPEFGAVTGDELTANQVKVLGQLHRGTKDLFNGIGIVLPEVGNGIVIWGKLFDEPHHFNVAPAFLLQDPGGAHPVQIPIDKQFEQY